MISSLHHMVFVAGNQVRPDIFISAARAFFVVNSMQIVLVSECSSCVCFLLVCSGGLLPSS